MTSKDRIDPEFIRRITANVKTVQALHTSSMFQTLDSVRASFTGHLRDRNHLGTMSTMSRRETAAHRPAACTSLATHVSRTHRRGVFMPALESPVPELPQSLAQQLGCPSVANHALAGCAKDQQLEA